ncbi:hypothetical protein OTK49_02195 [Vibrio coralliirubri]|uniref:hypothetical protein n=1 Tax=Vibrio coralliirubri TaxID=1516159 RepID=UPI002284709D|nr:hypothetical protein [Vibrio coralliirubri]MCY9861326.1 hypothetical protein [Vibrio coralliirubri]
MNDNKRDFFVPSWAVQNVLNESEKLKAKAAKLNVSLPEIELTDDVEIRGTPFLKDTITPSGQETKTVVYVNEPYAKFTIVGEAPRINGFSLVAKIEHGINKGEFMNTVTPEYLGVFPPMAVDALAQGVVNCPPNCQHCNTNRNRNTTFLLHSAEADEQGRHIVQVGSTCVDDFLGSKSLEALLYTQKLFDLSASYEPDMDNLPSAPRQDSGTGYINTKEYMTAAALIVDKYGFEPKGESSRKVVDVLNGRSDAHYIDFFIDRIEKKSADTVLQHLAEHGTAEMPNLPFMSKRDLWYVVESDLKGSSKIRSCNENETYGSSWTRPSIEDIVLMDDGDNYLLMSRNSLIHQMQQILRGEVESPYNEVSNKFINDKLPELLAAKDTPSEFKFDIKAMVLDNGVVPLSKRGFCGWICSKLKVAQPKYEHGFLGELDSKLDVEAEVVSMESFSKNISRSRSYSQYVDITKVTFKTSDNHLVVWEASKHISDIEKVLENGSSYKFSGKVSRHYEDSGETVTRIGGMRKFTPVLNDEPPKAVNKKKNSPKP